MAGRIMAVFGCPWAPRPSRQVLSCVAEGKQNKLIANRLGLSEHTVKLHIHHVIAKLGVNNRTEAAVWFLENHGSDHLVQ